MNGEEKETEEIKPSARFIEAEKGTGFVDLGEPSIDIPRSIHNGVFFLQFNLNTNFTLSTKETINVLKVALRHEIDHAYKEMFINQIFKIKNEGDGTDDRDFNCAYEDLNKVLFVNKSYKTQEEKNFLVTLYHLNYVERSAFVSGFYQRLLNDVKEGKLKDKEHYHEYEAFMKDKSFITDFKDVNIFNKYNEIVKGLFGSSTRDLKTYRYKAKHSADSAIDTMNKHYKFFEENRDSLKEHISLNDAQTIYRKRKNEYVHSLYESYDDYDDGVMNVYATEYLFTNQDRILVSINKMFVKQPFVESYQNVPYSSFLFEKSYKIYRS